MVTPGGTLHSLIPGVIKGLGISGLCCEGDITGINETVDFSGQTLILMVPLGEEVVCQVGSGRTARTAGRH